MMNREVNTIVEAYPNALDAQQAVSFLHQHGIAIQDISLITQDPIVAARVVEEAPDRLTTETGRQTGEVFGGAVGGGMGLLMGLGVLAVPGLAGVVALGWVAGMVGGALLGGATGGIIGALIGSENDERLSEQHAKVVADGGALLLVRCSNNDRDRIRLLIKEVGKMPHPIDPNPVVVPQAVAPHTI